MTKMDFSVMNVIEESQSSSPGFLPSRPDEGDMNSIQAGKGVGLTLCSLLVGSEAKTGKVHHSVVGCS